MVSKVVGAINVGLMWLVLGKLKVDKNLRWLLTIFFGLGTAHWYAAVWGTTWFFAHVVGVMFLLIALLLFFCDKSPYIRGRVCHGSGAVPAGKLSVYDTTKILA